MIQTTIFKIVEDLVAQFRARGWAISCNNFGLEVGEKALSQPLAGSSERSYIGIDDAKGTYVYFRENSGAVQLRGANFGSCQNGQIVTAQLRAVAVSNNLNNTPQILADKLYIDLSNAGWTNRFLPNIFDIGLELNLVWTNHSEIMLEETGGTRKDSPRTALAAIDFALSFTIQDCQMQPIKLC